ncbi:uncharacterized protein JCM6883_002047 [Sporobolomyces salmoneus]|uniref:uncharacterized protein n=1 Tax=Sporobolomyces salmoneus TaxID=183962 RepID=UPI00316CBED0
MSFFPAVGTVYPSLLHFKLDILKRGLKHSLNLVVTTGRPGVDQDIHCQLKAANSDDNSKTKYCDFRIIARSRNDIVKVARVDEVHTCDVEVRKANEEQARWLLEKKIGKLSKQVKEDPSTRPDSRRKQYKETVSEDEETEDEDEEKEQESDFADGNESDSEVDTKLLFPPAKDLSSRIIEIKNAGPVSLPSTDQAFDTAREMLALLHAYAQTRNFSIYRHSERHSVSKLTMVCTRRAARYKHTAGGQCDFEIRARKGDQDGKWRVLARVGNHNHSIAASSTVSHALAPPVHASTSPPAIPSSRKQTSNDLPIPLEVSPLSTSDHSPELVSFLRSFDPSPSTLLETITSLSRIGITTTETLVLILSTSESTFDKVKQEVGNGEVVEILETMRDELQAVLDC